MEKPVLVIMAAGMGSRYGGLKQIDPIDPWGNIIMDYSIYDAKQAGFEKVVFLIKKEIEEAFDEIIGSRIKKYMDVAYAYQELDKIPEGFAVPDGRTKPWGTAHAILVAEEAIGSAPFVLFFVYTSGRLPSQLPSACRSVSEGWDSAVSKFSIMRFALLSFASCSSWCSYLSRTACGIRPWHKKPGSRRLSAGRQAATFPRICSK